jgi:dTDP-4-amino-4,6-dideoxygalactose transaminase
MVYYPKPMHAQKAFDGFTMYVACPVAERLCDTVLSLPMHPYLEEADIGRYAP